METELTSSLRKRVGQIQTPTRLIIFCLSGIGDTLMFTPALKLLRLIWQGTHIVALTMKQSEYDLLHTNPDLDEVIHWPFLEKNPFASFKKLLQLRKQKFDLSILPCPSNRIQYNLISLICGAPRRAGFHYLKQSRQNLDFLNHFLLPHVDHVHNAEHNLQLVEKLTKTPRVMVPEWKPHLNLQILPHDHAEASRWLTSENIGESPFVSLHISSSRAKQMNRKCWPKEKFLQLIHALRATHPDLRFVIFCGSEDFKESFWLHQQGGKGVHLRKNIPIRTCAAILQKCPLFITSDSGLFHLASALKVPTLVLFGPTNPKRSGPWFSETSKVIRTGLDCSPCFYHTSHELTCPEGLNFKCIRDLPMEQVLQEALPLLNCFDRK